MSAPQEQPAGAGDNPSTGLSKFIRRASRVLRPKSAASAGEVASPVPTSTRPAAAPSQIVKASTTAPAPAPMPTRPDEVLRFVSMNTSRSTAAGDAIIPRLEPRDREAHDRHQQEKARLLFAKYGLTLQNSDWTPVTRTGATRTDWVDRKVRMRVHRQCHNCDTSFGASKECANCSHTRCTKCPRFPPTDGTRTAVGLAAGTKPEAVVAVGKSTEVDMAEAEARDDAETDDRPPLLVAPPLYLQIDQVDHSDDTVQRAIGNVHQRRGADVVYRVPTSRVRRFCHKCEALFKGRATTCESCGHQRCPNCPREPAKSAKFPGGYPGDVPEPEPLYPAVERVWRKPRVRVRYTCEQCNTVFASSAEKQCRNCKHDRCSNCFRSPPRRSTAASKPSEEMLRTLEGKFTGLQLLPDSQVPAT